MASLPGRRAVLLTGLALTTLTGSALGQTPRWVLETRVGGGYQGYGETANPLWPQGAFGRASFRLGHRLRIQRAVIRVGGGLGGTLYREGRNNLTWDAGIDGEWSLTRRTTIDAGARSSFGYGFTYSGTLEDVAVPPDALRRNDRFGATLHHRLSRRLDGVLVASGNHYAFDSLEPTLADGWKVGGRAGLERSLGEESLVSAFAEYERSSVNRRDYEIERLVVMWRHRLIRQLALELGGGFGRYRLLSTPPAAGSSNPAIEEPSYTPTAGAELVGTFGDHTVSAGLARVVGPVFGLGGVGVHRVLTLGYGATLGSRLDFSAAASDVDFLEGAVPSPASARNRTIRAGLRYALDRRLDALLRYTFWRRGEGVATRDRHTVWFGFQRAFTWR